MITDESTTSPTDVTATWIREQMADFKIKNARQLALVSKVSYVPLTKWLAGKLDVSSEGQKTLYWFFKCRDAERQIKEIK